MMKSKFFSAACSCAIVLWVCLTTPASGAFSSTDLPPDLAQPKVPAVECRPRQGLPNFLARLNSGAQVRIAYLGGSITAQEGWRPKTLKWFQQQYPKAEISQINAAIGGTGSDLGVFRCQQDVIALKPDLLFVEFAVNDAGAPPGQIYRCMEGIVRQTWLANPLTDICFVYTVAGGMLETLQAGEFPRSASAMERLADHYGIPSIHLGYEVAQLEKAGRLLFKAPKPNTEEERTKLGSTILFSPDGVHPYEDTGHQLYLEAVVRSWPSIQAAGKAGKHFLGEPFVADHWAAARMVPLDSAKLGTGWQLLDSATNGLARSFANRLPQIWAAPRPGTILTFRFKGTAVGFYDLLGPDCGQLSVEVDDRPPVKIARFDPYCTYHRLGKFMAAEGLTDGSHTVRVEVLAEPIDKVKVLAQLQNKMDDPKRFEGTAWYAGYLLVIGVLE